MSWLPRVFVLASIAILVACDSSADTTPGIPPARIEEQTGVLSTLAAMPAFADRLGRGQRLELHDGAYRLLPTVAETSALSARWVPTDARTARLDARIPASAKGALHVGVSDAFWIEIESGVDTDVAPRVIDGAVTFAGIETDTDLAYVAEPGRIEEVRILRSASARAIVRHRLRIGPAVARIRVHDGI